MLCILLCVPSNISNTNVHYSCLMDIENNQIILLFNCQMQLMILVLITTKSGFVVLLVCVTLCTGSNKYQLLARAVESPVITAQCRDRHNRYRIYSGVWFVSNAISRPLAISIGTSGRRHRGERRARRTASSGGTSRQVSMLWIFLPVPRLALPFVGGLAFTNRVGVVESSVSSVVI